MALKYHIVVMAPCGIISYLLIPWSRVLLEKLTGSRLVKKFPAFYGTRKFITAFSSARPLNLPWARPIQSMPPYPTYWRSILLLPSHLLLGLPRVCGLILRGRNKRPEKVTKCGGLQFALIKYNMMRWESYVARMEKKRNTYRILAVKSEGNGQLRSVRRRREYNIKTDTEYVEWRGGEADFLNAVLNHRVLWNLWNFLTSWGTVSSSRRHLHHEVSQLLASTRVRYSRFSSIGTERSNWRSDCLASKILSPAW